MRNCWLVTVCLALLAGVRSPGEADLWVKGNTHCHSTLSDGDVPPEQAIRWYREHGYGFVVLTDHNALAPLSVFDAATDASFVAISGEELTCRQGPDRFTVHVNALGIQAALTPVDLPDVAATLLGNHRLVTGAGGLLQANHPSYHLIDPKALTRLPDPFLIEVHNHSVVYEPMGKAALWAFEAAWDVALSAGRRAWAVASDDAHRYRPPNEGRDAPGGAWVMVRVQKLTRANVLSSLARGDFYASTGIEVAHHALEGTRLRVRVRAVPGRTYTVRFIGVNGRILRRVEGPESEYRLTGSPDERYVRVRVNASDGTAAWLQPVWPPARGG